MATIFMSYFLPVMFIASLGEGWTLVQWRAWTAGPSGLTHFDFGEIVIFEALWFMATCVIVSGCAYVVWLLRDPFYGRYNFSQALMLVMYSLCPLFLCQVLTGVPKINLWISWGLGVYFSLRVFFHGLRIMAKTDPGSVVGLYVISSAAIIGLTGTQRFMLFQCLSGHGSSINNLIYDLATKIQMPVN